jgi:hypothetical protein
MGQNFGEEEKSSDREGSEIEQSEGTEKLKPKEQNRGGKLSKKKRRTETWGSLHRGEEGPFLTTWAPPLCFLSSTTIAPSSPSLKQPCTVRNRRRNTEKKQKQRKKKQPPQQIFFSVFLPASATVYHHRCHRLLHTALHAGQTTAIAGQASAPLPSSSSFSSSFSSSSSSLHHLHCSA